MLACVFAHALLVSMLLLLCILAGWLLGQFPAAYLVTRWLHGLDVSTEGSGNVGANNAWRVTGSRRVGAMVLGLDALKGMLAVVAGWTLAATLSAAQGSAFWPGALALLGAVAGHNYNLLLSLSAGRIAGGKGLATAAGGFLLVAPWLVAAWVALAALGMSTFRAWRGVWVSIPGNVAATALVPAFGWMLYGGPGLVVTGIFAVLVLPKHVEQVRALLAQGGGVQEMVNPADTT